MIYLLIGLFILFWSLFIYCVIKKKRLIGFYLKGITSFLFILIFTYGIYKYISLNYLSLIDSKYLYFFILLFLGLISGLIGDLFLEVMYFYKEERFMQISFGMLIFLIGHLFYIIGISLFSGFNYFSLLIGAIMTLVVFLGGKFMKLEFKSLSIMTYLYTFIIFTMVGLTIFQAFALSFNAFSILMMIGALIFGVSDLLLAPIYFKEHASKFFVIGNLATYYLGQALIALSIFFII